jgi:hypothetical protein
MRKYKALSGEPGINSGINIGGEQFNADSSGCITIPDGNYHDLLTAAGWQLTEIQIQTEVIEEFEVPHASASFPDDDDDFSNS